MRVEETYIKDYKDGTLVVTYEGSTEDIERIRDFVKHMYDAQKCDAQNAWMCESNSEPKEERDMVNKPIHYCAGKLETIQKIERIVDGLPSDKAYLLGNIIKYSDRAGLKDDAEQDLHKANNYAYRLITGKWRKDN